MSDLISRQDAIKALQELDMLKESRWSALAEANPIQFVCRMYLETENVIEALPSAEPEQRWIPVTEALPENRNVVLVTAYWHETYQVMQASYFGSDWWCVPFNNCGKHMQKLNPIAWMPLPEVYRGE